MCQWGQLRCGSLHDGKFGQRGGMGGWGPSARIVSWRGSFDGLRMSVGAVDTWFGAGIYSVLSGFLLDSPPSEPSPVEGEGRRERGREAQIPHPGAPQSFLYI